VIQRDSTVALAQKTQVLASRQTPRGIELHATSLFGTVAAPLALSAFAAEGAA